MKQERYLMFVDATNNHNKFYKARLNDDNSIDIEYGRVGSAPQTHHYIPGERDFGDLIMQKLKKGYTEQTANHVSQKAAAMDYAPISEPDMRVLIEGIRARSRQFVKQNYVLELTDITEIMVRNAKDLLNEARVYAEHGYSVYDVNKKLTELFAVIPRRMAKVSDFLAKTPADYDGILTREKGLLDTLEQQVAAKQIMAPPSNNAETVLKANGLSMDDVTFSEEDDILRNLAVKNRAGRSNENNYIKAYRWTNQKTEDAFREYCNKHEFYLGKGTEFLYHGTKLENLWSIFLTGPKCRIQNAAMTGKAYGQGIYFANRSEKSMGYTSRNGSFWAHGNEHSGLLLVYEVALGRSYDPKSTTLSYDFNYNSLKAKGNYQSVYSEAYRNSECVIYQDCQCTIRYVVEVSERQRNFTIPIQDRLALTYDGAASGLQTDAGKWSVVVSIPDMPPKARRILDKYLDVGYTELIIGEDHGKPFVKTMNGLNALKSSCTENDMAWFVRTAKREFAATERAFAKLITDTPVKKKKSVEPDR